MNYINTYMESWEYNTDTGFLDDDSDEPLQQGLRTEHLMRLIDSKINTLIEIIGYFKGTDLAQKYMDKMVDLIQWQIRIAKY